MPRSDLPIQKERQITGLQLCAHPKFWSRQELIAHSFRSPVGITELEEPNSRCSICKIDSLHY